MSRKNRAKAHPKLLLEESDLLTGQDKIEALTEGESLSSQKDVPCGGVGIIINEVQLILAEKRTSLAAMRTGIAVFALPLSVLSVLVGTSKYYDPLQVIHLLLPLLVLCVALIVLGSYLVIRAIIKIRHQDQLILKLKMKHSQIAEFID